MATSAYGELVSFRTYSFDAQHGYLSELPRKVQATDAFVLGSQWPVDTYAGGPAPLASADTTFLYWIVASDAQVTAGTAAAAVDAAYASIEALLNTVGTLTIKNKAGSNLTVTARFVDCSVRESTREYSSMQINLVFKCYGPFA